MGLRILFCYSLLLLVSQIDWFTGREVHLGSIYLLVTAIASWNLSPRGLVIHAFCTALAWSVAERFSGIHYSNPWIGYWNMFNHLGSISITASVVYKAKTTLYQQQRLIRELRQTLLEISRFKELVPVCRMCHEFHFDPDYKSRLDELLRDDTERDSFGDVCPACLKARAERVANIPLDTYFQVDAS